jgi:hypothetical protein
MTRLAITECTTLSPFGDSLNQTMLVSLDPAAFLERPQIDRHAAARDVEATGNIGDAGPPAIGRTDFVNRKKVVGGAVRELVGLEFFPRIHWCLIYHTHD